MKVKMQQRGGLAGAIRRPPREVDSSNLLEGEAKELTRLVAELAAAPRVERMDQSRLRDSVLFTVTVEEFGNTTEFQQPDFDMSQEFAALVAWLMRR